MTLFGNRHRVESVRLANWDYGSNALYFVTICTKNRVPYFGNVANETMFSSVLGEVANNCWLEIPQHFPFVELITHVIMPNHMHGLLVINKCPAVETQDFASLPQNVKNVFGPQSKNLASIIRGYKAGVTKYARSNDLIFDWQPRFHDHVVRNSEGYGRIYNYIQSNPLTWEKDKFFIKQ